MKLAIPNIAVLTIASLSIVGGGAAIAAPVLDQSYLITNGTSGGVTNASVPDRQLAETFTVGIGGILSSVVVSVDSTNLGLDI